MTLQSEAVHYGFVGYNANRVPLGLERVNKNIVEVTMIGGHDVLITTASSDGEAPSIIGLELRDQVDLGIKIRLDSCYSFGGRLRFCFGGADALSYLGKSNLDSFIGRWTVLGGIILS